MKPVTRLILLLLAACALMAGGPASALDPALSIGQYKHTAWTADDGVPASIFELAQGRDGYLWIGARDGLFRFDGVRFELIPAPPSSRKIPGVSAILAANDGAVWAGYAGGGLSVYRDGVLRNVAMPNPEGYVMAIRQAADGAVWAMLGRPDLPLVRRHRGRWEEIGVNRGLPAGYLISLLAARDGAVWVTTLKEIYVLRKGAARFALAGTTNGHGALSQDPAGRIWLSDSGGTRALDADARRAFSYPTPNFPRAARTVFDRDGNLWGQNGRDGVFRLASPDPAGAPTAAAAAARVQVFRAADGLASDATSAVLQDREGTIWVGSVLGLDRFRAAAIVAEPLLTRAPMWNFALHGASDGTVYVGQLGSVYRVRPHGSPEPLIEDAEETEAICEGPDKAVWIVLRDRIVRVFGGAMTTVPRPAVQYVAGVQDCAVDENNTLWLTAVFDGVFALVEGRWRQTLARAEEDAPSPTNLTADRAGGLFLYSQVDFLFHLDDGVPTDIAPAPRPSIDDLNVLFQGRRDLLLAGAFGVARLRQGRLSFISPDRVPAFADPSGLVQTPSGDTWMMTRMGIVRIPTATLERAFDEPRLLLVPKVFDTRDGLPGVYHTSGKHDAVLGGDGRLWFATTGGVVWVDPARLRRNTTPPPVAISAMTAAGRTWRDPRRITLPAGTTSGQIDYTALSLSIPERVQFRYRLEGVNNSWVNPGPRRQMFFTNLGPGTYRFRVIAANNDGVWNREGAALEFTIPPTFLQSIWFQLICVGLLGGLLWLAYRLRMQQVAARIRSELEVRLAERERIARELHDTLLQGFQGLVLRFQAVAERIPPRQPLRKTIDEALNRADAVLVEGRDRVRELRHAALSGDLAQALIEAAGDLAADHPARFDLTIEGRPRDLHPMVREEAQRIGEEAIRNAFQHSRARAIEAVLTYRPGRLVLAVRDNGVGLPGDVAATGERAGHFGLTGMRERAESVGGALSVVSRQGAGTEVLLSIPARSAYAPRASGWRTRLRRLRRLWERKG